MKCPVCRQALRGFGAIVEHMIGDHPSESLGIMREGAREILPQLVEEVEVPAGSAPLEAAGPELEPSKKKEADPPGDG
jgi:hypothetical protein